MKKLIILSAIAMSGVIYSTANAQINVRLGLRFAPKHVVYARESEVVEQAPDYNQQLPVYNGDDQSPINNNDEYYYLPDVDAYYDVTAQCYYYNDGEEWISAEYLPGAYRDYDWKNARRYELRTNRPYLRDEMYRTKFSGREFTGWGNDRSNSGYPKKDYQANGNFYNAPEMNKKHFDGGFNNQGNRFNDREGAERYNQARDYNRGQSGFNRFQNPAAGSFNQPSDPKKTNREFNRGDENKAQPSPRNNGNSKTAREDHFAQNSPKNAFDAHRMNRF